MPNTYTLRITESNGDIKTNVEVDGFTDIQVMGLLEKHKHDFLQGKYNDDAPKKTITDTEKLNVWWSTFTDDDKSRLITRHLPDRENMNMTIHNLAFMYNREVGVG